MLSIVYGYTLIGISAIKISIEANVANGAFFCMVGLPDNAVKESYHRIISALKNSGKPIPIKGITINLAPADLRKEGSGYDLPIAVALLMASGQIPNINLNNAFIMGELSLSGQIRSVRGILPMLLQAKKEGLIRAVIPKENLQEASIVEGIEVLGFQHISEIIEFLLGKEDFKHGMEGIEKEQFLEAKNNYILDFKDVKGQENVKRGLQIAAAGGHNALLIGPPGSGKTMLSKRITGILPPLTKEESIESTAIFSVSVKNVCNNRVIVNRPFRSPHHTISEIALVGGGSNPKPGEISLAHNGVLFLDELPEFKRSVLEVLRQPLEDGKIIISRSKISAEFPSRFMLIASMNPCPCGYFGHPLIPCTCPEVLVSKYRKKISGPLLDRIDLHIEVNPVKLEDLNSTITGESSTELKYKIEEVRKIQINRFKNNNTKSSINSMMEANEIKLFCRICSNGQKILNNAVKQLNLSARAYDKILKVSRTIADLDFSQEILPHHLAEAIQYRQLDRNK